MIRFKTSPILFIFAALVLFLSSNARADCTGSGAAWSCASGSTSNQIQNAINSASDQAVITLANGTYNIAGVSLDGKNGITIICATVGGCTIPASGDKFTIDSCAGNINNLVRISGFTFTGDPGTALIWFFCNSDMTQVRIDHNTFKISGSNIAILFGEITHTGQMFGVVDHNTASGTNNFMLSKNISGGTNWAGKTGRRGTSNNMFYEDNTCNFTAMPDNGTGCFDSWYAQGSVYRFNTMTNGRLVNHSYCHEGPLNSEVYGNTINTPADPGAPQYRNIHFQGSGEEIAFGNKLEDDGATSITVQHFRGDASTADSEGDCNTFSDGTVTGTGLDAAHANDGNRSPTGTNGGYPAWHQPGRDAAATLSPVYIFMNHTTAGAKVDMHIGSCTGGSGCTVQMEFVNDRDYFNAVSANAQSSSSSPFNGTTGVGFGTLANRPTTCTNKSQAADAGHGGVGYWATDQGSWNTSGNGFGNGVLYACTASNTWTQVYTPYTYPHPLVSGGAVGGPFPPTGLQASVQ